MKKISLITMLLFSVAFSQLRVGLDLSRSAKSSVSVPAEMKAAFLAAGEEVPGSQDLTAGGLGLNVGYELMLLSLVGVGAEANLGIANKECDEEDDKCYEPDNQYFGYGVVKFPVFPMVRAVIRGGLVMSSDSNIDAGLGLGFGVRVKPPILPIGVEASYNIYNLSSKEELEGLGNIEMDLRQSYFNLSATYSF
tara:strand:+ start:70 stop:651 length:582 start_codon:yes stop_codon:yes gene_type:complete